MLGFIQSFWKSAPLAPRAAQPPAATESSSAGISGRVPEYRRPAPLHAAPGGYLQAFTTLLNHCLRFAQSCQADLTLFKLSELTPNRIRTLGPVQGIIFDLDDTLMPMLSGRFPSGLISRLKNLKEAGFQMGIVTNNIQPRYCEKVREKLASHDLDMPFIEDARKPNPEGFETMRRHFGLPANQVAVIGDGILSDIRGARQLGMKTVRARWIMQGGLRREPLLFLWDMLLCVLNLIRSVWNPAKQSRISYHAQQRTIRATA